VSTWNLLIQLHLFGGRYLTTKAPDHVKSINKNSPFSPSSYLSSLEDQEEEQQKAEDEKDAFITSPGPNLEQKVPSEGPMMQSTLSLMPQVCV